MSRPGRHAAAALASALCGTALIAGFSAQAEQVQRGNLRLSLTGKMRPQRLPRQGQAPITVTLATRITTADAGLPPQLRTLRIELNRHGHLEHAGLHTCPYDSIQPGSSDHALAACRAALVGSGSFEAQIILAGSEPIPSSGRLLLFNGARGGRHVLLGHIYSNRPFATSFVIVFKIAHSRRVRYGTVLSAVLPRAMESWGRLTAITMTLSRRYEDSGIRRSFLSSSCPAPADVPIVSFPLARVSFDFTGNVHSSAVLQGSYRPADDSHRQ